MPAVQRAKLVTTIFLQVTGGKTCRTNVIRPPDDAMTMNECIGRLSGRRDAQGLTMYAGCRAVAR